MSATVPIAIDAAQIATVAHARIFFAHQSVGGNIVEALATLRPTDPRFSFRIVDGRDAVAGPFFAHARLGRNGDPRSKTDEFVALLGRGLGARLDVALQKYCFADIDERTDVAALFEHYRDAMRSIHRTCPHLVLVHVTAPLTVVQDGPRAFAKKLLGRMPDHYADNFRREQFNDLMRAEYSGREPLFDLAALEARDANGVEETVRFGNRASIALAPGNASDGGHLNREGSERAARALVSILAAALDGRNRGANPGG